MSARSTSISRKGLAIVTAGLFAMSSLSFTSAAVAQEEPVEVSQNLVNQLNKNDQATITIHKKKGGFVGTNQYGVEQDVPGDALGGIAFDVYKVPNIDLSTTEGWRTYADLEDKNPNSYVNNDNYVDTLITNNSGEATATLPIGVYVVVENLSKSTAAGKKNLTPAAPFITALPLTNAGGTAWNRAVHVYPKNQELTSTKTVEDKGQHASDTIKYTLDASVPPVPSDHQGRYFDGFSLLDIYDPSKWTPDTDAIAVRITGGESPVVLGSADFQVSQPGPYNGEQGKNAFTISLTENGLKKLEDAAKKGNVHLVATVEGGLAQELEAGDLANKLRVIPPNTSTPNWDRSNKPDDPNDPPVDPTPETEVQSKYGRIEITKTGKDAQGNTGNLEGAKFELHKCDNGTAGQDGTLQQDSKAIEIGGQTEWTTDANGRVTITGIQLEDFYNGTTPENGTNVIADTFDYCLVETKAPAGYELLPKPIITPVNTTTVGQNNAPYVRAANIENVRTTTETFRLPATGEWGRWWLVAGGVLAILIAAGVLVSKNRRDAAA